MQIFVAWLYDTCIIHSYNKVVNCITLENIACMIIYRKMKAKEERGENIQCEMGRIESYHQFMKGKQFSF